MAKILTNRQEIAKAINFGKYPVLTLDIYNHGGFDDSAYSIGCDVRVAYNTSRHGVLHTNGHLFVENGKFAISGSGACIKSGFGLADVEKMAHWANTPVVKADDVVVVVMTSKEFGIYLVELMKVSKRVDPHCTTVVTLEHISEDFEI